MKYIENIAKRVRYAEERAAVIYAKPDGLLYKRVKLFYIISAVISVMMYAFYVLGRLSRIQAIKEFNLNTVNADAINSATQSAISVSVCALLFIAAVIILNFKTEIVSAIITVLSGAVSLGILAVASQNTQEYNSGINISFWFRHFIPVIITIALICWLAAIRIRADKLFKTAYTNMINRIYEQYNSDDLSEENWTKFLETYDPRAEEEKRRRAKKGYDDYKNVINDTE